MVFNITTQSFAMKSFWILILMCLFLAGCGEEKKPYQAPVPQTPAPVLFQTERQALEKAKRVEQTLDEHTRSLEQKSGEQ
jgi:PBP1b-binding outer membrane lipoprotein LpoB